MKTIRIYCPICWITGLILAVILPFRKLMKKKKAGVKKGK